MGYAAVMGWLVVGVWWVVISQAVAWVWIMRRVCSYQRRYGFTPPLDPWAVVRALVLSIPAWPILVWGMLRDLDSD